VDSITVLSLDLSTKTGYSVAHIKDNKYELLASGTLPKIEKPKIEYPMDYLQWSWECFREIEKLMKQFSPDKLVIEETSKGSKNNFSQKILEFIHLRVAEMISYTMTPAKYYRTEEWRRVCGCLMTTEEKKQNKTVRTKHGLGEKVVKDSDGKRLGKVGKKHVNVRRVNELFNLDLKLKDEDRADAILLGYAFFLEQK